MTGLLLLTIGLSLPGLASADTYRYAGQFNDPDAAGPLGVNAPAWIADGPSGGIYVPNDASDTIELYGSDYSTGTPGAVARASTPDPRGVAIANDGTIYAVDGVLDQITVHSPDGNTTTFGSTGSATGQFDDPSGIAVDPRDGTVFVVDSGNDRVQAFTAAGVYKYQFGSSGSGNGQFQSPRGIDVDKAGVVYVTDISLDTVQSFQAGPASATYLNTIGGSGSGPGEFSRPADVAIGRANQVIVADTDNDRVEVFDSNGAFQSEFGTPGSSDGQFAAPFGIAANSDGEVWVADSGNDRIQFFFFSPELIGGPNRYFGDVTVGKSSAAQAESDRPEPVQSGRQGALQGQGSQPAAQAAAGDPAT